MNDSIISFGEIRPTQTNFVWVIRQFKELLSKFEIIQSPIIQIKTVDESTMWKLLLYPNEEIHKEDEKYMGIYIKYLNRQSLNADINLSITLPNNNHIINFILDNQEFKQNDAWGTSKFVKRDEILSESSDILKDNTLKIACTIRTEKTIRTLENDNHLRLLLFEQFENLINNKTFNDVILSVDGKDIFAYKGILASVSPVFQAMFTHNMSETKNNIVIIKDVDYPTMLGILRYIYTGKIDPKSCSITNLLIAAEKYQLSELKRKCERELCDLLSVNDIFEYLSLADLYNCPYLKEKAVEFIVSNVREIVESSEFEAYKNLHPDLACEVFRALAYKRIKK